MTQCQYSRNHPTTLYKSRILNPPKPSKFKGQIPQNSSAPKAVREPTATVWTCGGSFRKPAKAEESIEPQAGLIGCREKGR